MRHLRNSFRLMVLAASAFILISASTGRAQAQEYPDFYGTVIAADRPSGVVTLQVAKGLSVPVRVSDLGDAPWNDGAFLLDNVIVLRTHRVGGDYYAISWEEARNGRERFRG